jgi:hypothetical protein
MQVPIPDDVVGEIFSYFKLDLKHRKATDIRYDKKSVALLRLWSAIMITCKSFLRVGRRVFDPSIKSNRAFRSACERGYLLNVLSTN